jgi:hypothetical protein
MKPNIAAVLAVVLFYAVFLGAGCDRSSRKGDSRDSDADGPQISNQTEFAPRGFAAIQYAPIYDLSSGRPEWIGAPDFGEALEFDTSEINGELKPGKPVPHKPRSIVIDDNDVYLIPILWNGRRGWIDASHYAPENSRIGVVVEQFETPYRQDEYVFRRGDLLIFDPDNKFNVLYAPAYGLRVNNAVNSNQISFDSDDIETGKLLAKVKAARGVEREQELLRSAAEKYPDSVLISLINEMLNPGDRKTESLVALFSTVSEETLVYVKPDLLSSAVVAHLEPYTDVRTIERTIKQESTRDGSSRWYHISEPVNGWIFGLSIEGAD